MLSTRNITKCLQGSLTEEDNSIIELSPKAGYIDLTSSKGIPPVSLGFQDNNSDKLLRILTYKYYDDDLVLIYSNQKNFDEAVSLNEEEMENLYLQESIDELPKPLEVKYHCLPISEQPEIVFIDEGSWFKRVWKCLRNIFTLRSCRERCNST